MKRYVVICIAMLFVLASAATALAVTELHVIRKADNSLCVMTCNGTVCGACTAITGGFSTQPTVSWDEYLQKFVLMGVGNNGISVWRRLFNANGTAFSDWQFIANVTPGPISPLGSAGMVFPSLKNASTGGLVTPGAGVNAITNLLSLTYTAPAAGYVYVSASGYCNIPTGGNSTHFTLHVASTSTADWPANNPGFFFFPGGSNMSQAPFAVTNVLPAIAGTNTAYLNFKNISGLGGFTCAAMMTVIYTPAKLP